MEVKLENVVPWGRSLNEYIRMFDLSLADKQLTILDCGGGPSSFNAEMTQAGYKVISCDPIYQYTQSEIAERIQETYPVVLSAVLASQDKFVWEAIASPEALGQVRMASMNRFLEDFPKGVEEGRYIVDELPKLSFKSGQFDLVLCSHLLFTYSKQLSFQFHLASILELCRVAKEVRIFPLLVHFSGEPSNHLQPVVDELTLQGYSVEICQVPYEFQRHGNQLLRVLA